jgi:hypothetical protein
MMVKDYISYFLKYTFLAICFLAISTNILSFHPKSKLIDRQISKKEHKKDSDENKEISKVCAYEAVVPTVHFNIIYTFCFVVNVGVIQTPVETVSQSPPLFTTPFYRTLFRMIIAPNAP